MRYYLTRILVLLLAALTVVTPVFALAAPKSEPPTRNMTRSERSIRSIISEDSEDIRSTLFTEFVNSRLKYVTVRSLAKSAGSNWIGYVDIVEELNNEKHVSYVLDQGVIQYGKYRLPSATGSAKIEIGNKSETMEYDGETVFSFSNMELADTAMKDEVTLQVEYHNNYYDIDLDEHYPNDSMTKDDTLAAMATAYAKYAADSEELQLVDHAVLKLRSYIANSETQKRSYIWELYLVHGAELPAQATLVRYYPASDSTLICARTLRDYF